VNAPLAPIIAIVGERPSEELADHLRDDAWNQVAPYRHDHAAVLEVPEELAAIIVSAAEAVLLARLRVLPPEEALRLSLSSEGLAFLEGSVAYHNRLEARRAAKRAPNVISIFDWRTS